VTRPPRRTKAKAVKASHCHDGFNCFTDKRYKCGCYCDGCKALRELPARRRR
jgi:hypothetical protein